MKSNVAKKKKNLQSDQDSKHRALDREADALPIVLTRHHTV